MRALLTFLGARVTRALVAVWLVSTVVFVVMRLSGDPVPLLLPPDAPRSEYARVAKELGTDRPLPVQYAVFLGHVARGDFGRSIHFREPAMRVALGYLPATAELGLTAFALAVLVAVVVPFAVLAPHGLWASLRTQAVRPLQIESLGANWLDLGVTGAEAEGGYARELTPEEMAAQQQALEGRIADFDAVITTAAVPGRPAPKIIPASAVEAMRPGSVIVSPTGMNS